MVMHPIGKCKQKTQNGPVIKQNQIWSMQLSAHDLEIFWKSIWLDSGTIFNFGIELIKKTMAVTLYKNIKYQVA